MIDASCWLTVFYPTHISNGASRPSLSTRRTRHIICLTDIHKYRCARHPRRHERGNVRRRDTDYRAGSHAGGSKPRPPCRIWKEPLFDVGTFLSSLNSFDHQPKSRRSAIMKPVSDVNAIKPCCTQGDLWHIQTSLLYLSSWPRAVHKVSRGVIWGGWGGRRPPRKRKERKKRKKEKKKKKKRK